MTPKKQYKYICEHFNSILCPIRRKSGLWISETYQTLCIVSSHLKNICDKVPLIPWVFESMRKNLLFQIKKTILSPKNHMKFPIFNDSIYMSFCDFKTSWDKTNDGKVVFWCLEIVYKVWYKFETSNSYKK